MPRPDTNPPTLNPWRWIPSLYFAEGLPYVTVMTVAVVMFKSLGISNTDIALYTSWLYLPWVIKPLWSPLVEIFGTRRFWIWFMQIAIGGGMAGVALTVPAGRPIQLSLAFFWLLAFSSATQDIAIDGFYMLAATEKQQAAFSGVRNLFYRLASICGQGLLVMLVGLIQDTSGLAKVQLPVSAAPGAPQIQDISLPPPTSVPLPGPLHIVVSAGPVVINPQPITTSYLQPFLNFTVSNNVGHLFRPPQLTPAPESTQNSWWHRQISGPLRAFLQAHFGVRRANAANTLGNVGSFTVHLSQPPGREVVVTVASRLGFGLKPGGEGNFSILEGARLVFNNSNWNQPAVVLIQLDPRLTESSTATIEIRSGNTSLAWTVAFVVLAALFIGFGFYHKLTLPRPTADVRGANSFASLPGDFWSTFAAFVRKRNIVVLLLFMVLYRFAEAQLVKLTVPFLLDAREAGGLGLTAAQTGFVYGTIGVASLVGGGLLAGWLVSRHGLKSWLWWMVCALHLPDAAFVYLASAQPGSLWTVNLCVAVEQFGYGFGFTAYMLYLIYISRGEHQTAHYAICTGFMALGMMIPGMWSGWLEDTIGYQHFFIWVLLATIPGFLVTALIPLDPDFGRRHSNPGN